MLAEGGHPERGNTEMLLEATAVANFLDSRLGPRMTPKLRHRSNQEAANAVGANYNYFRAPRHSCNTLIATGSTETSTIAITSRLKFFLTHGTLPNQ